jgi:uncharacterized protein YajQ (UPF0234 family)
MPSFDIVSKPSWAEIDNALQQASKEIVQRFDFKDTDTDVARAGEEISIASATEDRLRAALDVLQSKLVKRKVSLRYLDVGEPERGPKGSSRLSVKIKDGVPLEKAREIVKHVKDQKLKVQASIQESLVRVSGKNKDDLQHAIQALRAHDFGL